MTDDRGLRLRPLRGGDEAAFREGHRAMAASDGFPFGLGLEAGMSWNAYLTRLDDERAGTALAVDRVPATFLVADIGGEIVGRTSIRHELNDYLWQKGGHIGYGVLPGHRRRGYATEILRQSVVVARSIGVDRVLVTCHDDNAGSIAVIEACGGWLDSLVEDGAGRLPIRRYWID